MAAARRAAVKIGSLIIGPVIGAAPERLFCVQVTLGQATALDRAGLLFKRLNEQIKELRGDGASRPAAAAREQMSYRGFLAELLIAECDDRARRRSERRIKAAGFPREKSLRAVDFGANPSVNPAVIHILATCDWVKRACRCA